MINELNLAIQNCYGTLLQEERGVGASREFLDVVKEVVDYCAATVKSEDKGFDDRWHITVPENITKKFNIFTKLNLEVTIEDNARKGIRKGGGGQTEIDSLQKLIPGENNVKVFALPVDIKILGYSDGNTLFRRSVAVSLVHELNHKLEDYYRSDNGTTNALLSQSVALTELRDIVGDCIIFDIFYRLFSETEQNALIASVYGDLESLNSVRENFKRDIKKTKAYQVWEELRDYVPDLETEDENFKELARIFAMHPELNSISPLPSKKVTVNNFKQAFLKKFKRELDVLFKGIGRVASYYYDMVEDKRKTRTSI